MRRVVVTGMGVLSPIGCTMKEAWNNLINANCGIRKLKDPEYELLPCKVAGHILKDGERLDLNQYFTKSELNSMAPATAYALLAAKEALEDANWIPTNEEDRLKTGVAVGIGMVDLNDICNTYEALKKSYKRISPFFVPRILPNMAAGNISITFGFRGPNHSVSTACATGAHAIGDAYRFIKFGDADVMVCGGAEACISPLSIAAFCRLKALSNNFNETPDKASRPFDRDRDGFVMGEGSAMLVLEELTHAQNRFADIYGEVIGYGLSGDASHLTAPTPDGTGAVLAMKRAMEDAKIPLTDVGYINAHATSTPMGDAIETIAIKKLFGDHSKKLAVSSTKGAHGHLLGSAGNLEAVFTILSVKYGILPPTLNVFKLNKNMDLNYVPNVKQMWITDPKSDKRRIALKNAFGFGGTNASLCFAEYQE